MSVIFSIIRIANPSGPKIHKQITYLIAASFACMWAALIALKIKMCISHSCQMAEPVAISQLISQCISLSLTAMVLNLYSGHYRRCFPRCCTPSALERCWALA
jgi:hypothetical protein